MKAILKPAPVKTILTLLLFFGASLLWRQVVISRISDAFPWGFPLQFYFAWGPCPPGEACYEFNETWLVIDLAIWYLISAFILNMVKREKPA